MARAFSETAFTPAVRARQARHGSAKLYDRFLAEDAERNDVLTEAEAAFIAARDGFYQATVSETGWPYVQFRGGPKGFLKRLDPRRVAYADFRGNRQYVSVGNLDRDDRVSLILMDYPNQRRLKLFGRAKTVEIADDAAFVDALSVPGYRARPERAVVIAVEGFDWNCPSHIPQRFTLDELEPHLAPFRRDLAALSAENAQLKAQLAAAGAPSDPDK